MKEIVHDFLKGTSYGNLSDSPQERKLPQPALELPLPPNARLIPLPAPAALDIAEIGLREAVERRRSVRRYAAQPLTLAELSYLLWMTQGVKEVTARPVTLRTVPSAGARHAFETYLLINDVEGLEPGLYRFAASKHALLKLDSPAEIRNLIHLACGQQAQVYNSAVTFIWVAVLERMAWRYVERGMRYLHLDAGHVCQNLYLAAEAIDCGVCAIAAYNDESLNAALEIDGENLFTIYLGTVGKKQVES
jgi:SagB-type dehydrogenase family enzyme